LDEHVTDIRTRVDLPALLADLTLEEKAALLDGSDFWHTQGNERLGIPAIMLTDGAHGLRKQATSAENLTLTTSVPAMLPAGRGPGVQLGPGAAAPVGGGHAPRGRPAPAEDRVGTRAGARVGRFSHLVASDVT
jgi:hypothetical protein